MEENVTKLQAFQISNNLSQKLAVKYIITNQSNLYLCLEECLFSNLLNLEWSQTSWVNLSKILDVVIKHFNFSVRNELYS